jgi:hypothetical protein
MRAGSTTVRYSLIAVKQFGDISGWKVRVRVGNHPAGTFGPFRNARREVALYLARAAAARNVRRLTLRLRSRSAGSRRVLSRRSTR